MLFLLFILLVNQQSVYERFDFDFLILRFTFLGMLYSSLLKFLLFFSMHLLLKIQNFLSGLFVFDFIV